MKRTLLVALAILAASLGALAFSALVGLALHRANAPLITSLAATFLVLCPPLAAGGAAPEPRRYLVFSGLLALWSLGLLLVLPVYFPGERQGALASGLAALTAGDRFGLAQGVSEQLPEELATARPELAEASLAELPLPPAPAGPLNDDQIALPYEGEGRRLTVPVVFHHNGREIEVQMMLDTGATYTTLSSSVLSRLGLSPGADAPSLELHTANGVREAKMALADGLWLGDLLVEGVAIAECDACASDDTAGLLGLNVSGGFNLTIDADRHEVVLTRRTQHDRQLDVRPFVKLSANFTRYPGGRVEVELRIENLGQRALTEANAAISCGDNEWTIPIDPVGPLEVVSQRRKLPSHDDCDGYQIRMRDAAW